MEASPVFRFGGEVGNIPRRWEEKPSLGRSSDRLNLLCSKGVAVTMKILFGRLLTSRSREGQDDHYSRVDSATHVLLTGRGSQDIFGQGAFKWEEWLAMSECRGVFPRLSHSPIVLHSALTPRTYNGLAAVTGLSLSQGSLLSSIRDPASGGNHITRTPPPSKRTGFDSQAGHSRISARGNRAGRYCCSAGFLGDIPFLPPLYSGAAPYSHRFTLIGSRDLDFKCRPNLFTHLFFLKSVPKYGYSMTVLMLFTRAGCDTADFTLRCCILELATRMNAPAVLFAHSLMGCVLVSANTTPAFGLALVRVNKRFRQERHRSPTTDEKGIQIGRGDLSLVWVHVVLTRNGSAAAVYKRLIIGRRYEKYDDKLRISATSTSNTPQRSSIARYAGDIRRLAAPSATSLQVSVCALGFLHSPVPSLHQKFFDSSLSPRVSIRNLSVQGDTLKEHTEICKDSSSGSQPVLSAIPLAASMGTDSAGDNDEIVNPKDGMSAVEWVCMDCTLARLSREVNELQNKRLLAPNTDEQTTPATKKRKLSIEYKTGGEDDHEESIEDNEH
ncbi:hypothetical protein PR048_006751 [Dryococelus australis]|uniref:Uncharacterized protein n=1 Tax=Dryococelus australis TaxID=614101 RepID=A0ABQ9ICT5_9NEOP|nr:hypothetical protein PR048_006751 [Dryococelus australis]